MRKRIVCFLLGVVLVFSASACTAVTTSSPSPEEVAKVEAERDNLKGELEKARSENEALIAQVSALQAKIDSAAQQQEVQKGDVTVALTNKTTSNGDYGQLYANFEFSVTNNTDKAIRGVQGIAQFNDIFGSKIISLNGDFTGATIDPGATHIFNDLSLDCNQFMSDHLKLYNTKYEDLKFDYETTAIVFADGTTKN